LGITVGVFLRNQASGGGEMVGNDAESTSIIRFNGRHIEGTGKVPFF
jgi:hypothetical protein